MGLLGDVFSLPVRIVNAPLKLVDKAAEVIGDESLGVSEPLEDVADAIQELDD